MALYDYRLDPFLDSLQTRSITNEGHTIPTSSPFTIRLDEVPYKADPTSMVVKFADGTQLSEVAVQPAQGCFFPDYYTGADGDNNWNTGTLQFNSADAGKVVYITYQGTGTLIDARLPDMLTMSQAGMHGAQRAFANTPMGASVSEFYGYAHLGEITEGEGNKSEHYYRTWEYVNSVDLRGLRSLRNLVLSLASVAHTHTLQIQGVTKRYNCDCDCSDGE